MGKTMGMTPQHQECPHCQYTVYDLSVLERNNDNNKNKNSNNIVTHDCVTPDLYPVRPTTLIVKLPVCFVV